MEIIYQKALELADAIRASSLYTDLQHAKECMMQSEMAREANALYDACYTDLNDAVKSGHIDRAEVARRLKAAQSVRDTCPEIASYEACQASYAALLDNVSDMLRVLLGGAEQAGCSGNCNGCPGCGRQM
ncbi:MAG: YlbF family regulator [Clostridia bacterium]|nr:YlbF family regulator [Clostridia bacterium]